MFGCLIFLLGIFERPAQHNAHLITVCFITRFYGIFVAEKAISYLSMQDSREDIISEAEKTAESLDNR